MGRPNRRAVLRAAGVLAAGVPLLGAGFPWTRELRVGSTGADVRELQIRVAGWAADAPARTYVAVDGEFGPATEAAVVRFQRAYGLGANGVVARETHDALNALESTDGTRHFTFAEFHSKDGSAFAGGKVSPGTVRENVRVLMYKLEALRRKAGNAPVTINSGFRSTSHNAAVGGAPNSQHMYGITADLVVRGKTTRQVYVIAETCGFSGLERHTNSWQHVDSRVEYDYGAKAWWWESGTVTRSNPGRVLPPEPHPTC